MKKLSILLIFLLACNSPSDVKEPEGEILQVVQQGDKTFIKVKFHHAGDDRLNYIEWFAGADTCQVGQKVRLQ